MIFADPSPGSLVDRVTVMAEYASRAVENEKSSNKEQAPLSWWDRLTALLQHINFRCMCHTYRSWNAHICHRLRLAVFSLVMSLQTLM